MATAAKLSDPEAADIQIVAAFDMRDPAQVAALNSLLQFTPVEKAQHRVSAAYRAVEDFARRHIGPAWMLTRTIPADMEPAKAEALADLLVAERDARAKVRALGASVSAAQAKAA